MVVERISLNVRTLYWKPVYNYLCILQTNYLDISFDVNRATMHQRYPIALVLHWIPASCVNRAHHIIAWGALSFSLQLDVVSLL